MGKLMNLQYEFLDESIFDVKEINTSFASGSLKVLYTGENRNGSSISKEAVVAALPTIRNVPIVCHYDYETNEIGGHDMEIVVGENGDIRLRNLTTPVGVVPNHAKFRFENETDENGKEHEYLVVDGVLLWKRQDEYNHIMNDLGGKVSHSMEIRVNDGFVNKDTGIYEIKDFEFTALCLLETATPCFEGSELELFSALDFKTKMEQMMRELKEMFSLIDTPNTEIDICFQENITEGGEITLDEKNNLIAEYGLEATMIDFSIEDLTIEELKEKLESMKGEEFSASEELENSNQNYELDGNIRESLYSAVSVETIQRSWGEEPKYWMIDFDVEKSEVYVEDVTDWNIYAFTYSMNGDNAVVNFEDKRRMKWAIVEYDEGEQILPFAKIIDSVEQKYSDNNAQWSEKYQVASDTIESLNNEIDTLRQFKIDVEKVNREKAIDNVFSQFEDLAGVEAFESLRECAEDYSVEDLEEKCYAIRGRHGIQNNFSYDMKSPKIKVTEETPEYEPYGGLVKLYLGK